MTRITKNNFEKLCRTCMKAINNASPQKKRNNKRAETGQHQLLGDIPNTNKSDRNITNSILELLYIVQPQIIPELNDNLPNCICMECVDDLIITHTFLKTYQESDAKFRQFLKKYVPVKSEIENELFEDELVHVAIENVEDPANVEAVDSLVEKLETKDETLQEQFCDILKEEEIEEFNDLNGEFEEINKDDSVIVSTSFENDPGTDDENDEDFLESEYFELEEEDEEELMEDGDSNSNHLSALQEEINNLSKDENNKESMKGKIKTEKKVAKRKHEAPPKMNEDGTLPCKYCDANIKGVTKWRVHMRQHRKDMRMRAQFSNPPEPTEDGKYPCDDCETEFENLTKWKLHMKEHRRGFQPKRPYIRKNPDGTTKTYKCEYCEKEFDKLEIYKYHLKGHTGEGQALCMECGKTFKTMYNLKIHMQRHKGEKTKQCPHCPKKFVCSSGLYCHMSVHSKEKTHACEICGQAFYFAHLLRTHMLYHDNVRKYKCQYCDMRFVTGEKQRRHMRTHTGEKPYKCRFCERAYAQSNDCVKHLRQHLGDEIYQCDLCPLRFSFHRDLRAHFPSHKDDDEETKTNNLIARAESEKALFAKLGLTDRNAT